MKKRIWATTNRGVSLYPICLLGEVLYYDFHKLYGRNLEPGMADFKNDVNRWALYPGDRDAAAAEILSKVLRDKKWVKHILADIYAACNVLLSQAKANLAGDLKKISAAELLSRYQKYNQKFKALYLPGWLANAVEGESDVFSRRVAGELAARLRPLGKGKSIGAYFSQLTTLPQDSVRDRERQDFLRLLARAGQKPDWEKLLLGHWRKYCWLQYDYNGPALPLSHFTAAAKAQTAAKIKPRAELKKIAAERAQLIKNQRRLEKELELNRAEIYLFWLARQFSFVKGYRKDVLYQSYYLNDFLLSEIGRRLNLTLKQVKHILPAEMAAALRGKKLPAELNARIKYSVLVYGKSAPAVLTGSQARELVREKIASESAAAAKTELAGQTAYPGQASGRVRIVNSPQEMSAFKTGEILVSEKTNPNLLSAMKKAAAIVTDAGGLTCHAAIVSRELKTPCIVGTRLGTKVLKNGMRVSVDANLGKVVIL